MSKLEDLSIKYQGFLFYPLDDKSDRKMLPILTDKIFETEYRALFKNKSLTTKHISKEVSNFLEKRNWTIEKIQKERTRTLNKLFNIPVMITEDFKTQDNEVGYLIKILGKNHKIISKKLDLIKENLEYVGIKPKECIRDRKDLEEDMSEEDIEDNIEDDVENEDIEKEIEEDAILRLPHIEKDDVLDVPHIDKDTTKKINKINKPNKIPIIIENKENKENKEIVDQNQEWKPPTKEEMEKANRLARDRDTKYGWKHHTIKYD